MVGFFKPLGGGAVFSSDEPEGLAFAHHMLCGAFGSGPFGGGVISLSGIAPLGDFDFFACHDDMAAGEAIGTGDGLNRGPVSIGKDREGVSGTYLMVDEGPLGGQGDLQGVYGR